MIISLNSNLTILYETDAYSIIKLGNTVRFVGYCVLSSNTSAWNWICNFTFFKTIVKTKNEYLF